MPTATAHSGPIRNGVVQDDPATESHIHVPVAAIPRPSCDTSAQGVYALTVRYG